MASLTTTKGDGKKPNRRVQFTDGDGIRRTIHLGRIGLPAAREIKNRVEAILSHRIAGNAPGADLSAWLAALPDKLHARLAGVGLVAPREPVPTLGSWLDSYIRQRRADLKPSTIEELGHTRSLLIEHFGDSMRIDRITADNAQAWGKWLGDRTWTVTRESRRNGQEPTSTTRRYSVATVRKHVRNAKSMFNAAVERQLIGASPFRKLASASSASKREYLGLPESERILF